MIITNTTVAGAMATKNKSRKNESESIVTWAWMERGLVVDWRFLVSVMFLGFLRLGVMERKPLDRGKLARVNNKRAR